jgi:hypothetical protein
MLLVRGHKEELIRGDSNKQKTMMQLSTKRIVTTRRSLFNYFINATIEEEDCHEEEGFLFVFSLM